MLFTNSLVPAAIVLTSAKRTELYLLAHKNTRSRIKESAIYKHLRQCDNIQHIQGLYNLPDIFSNKTGPPSTTTKEFFTEEPPSIQRSLSHKTLIVILEQWLEGQQRTLLILMTVFLFLFCTYFILTCLLMLIYHPFSI